MAWAQIKVENICEPKLEPNEFALLEDPLNVSNDVQGPLCKSEVKSEISDIDESYSETPICPPIKTEQDSSYNIKTEIKSETSDVRENCSKIADKPELKETKYENLPFKIGKQIDRVTITSE